MERAQWGFLCKKIKINEVYCICMTNNLLELGFFIPKLLTRLLLILCSSFHGGTNKYQRHFVMWNTKVTNLCCVWIINAVVCSLRLQAERWGPVAPVYAQNGFHTSPQRYEESLGRSHGGDTSRKSQLWLLRIQEANTGTLETRQEYKSVNVQLVD